MVPGVPGLSHVLAFQKERSARKKVMYLINHRKGLPKQDSTFFPDRVVSFSTNLHSRERCRDRDQMST